MAHIAILVAMVILVMYCWYAIAINGLPVSISDTFYTTGYLFCIVMFIVAVCTCISLLSIEDNILSFLVGASIGFVGASPLFKTTDRKVHYTSAFVCLIASQLWVALFCSPYLLLMWLTAFLWYGRKSWCFWAEIVMIATTITGVFLK